MTTPVTRTRQLLRLLPRDGWTLTANGCLRRVMDGPLVQYLGTMAYETRPCCPLECAAGGTTLSDAIYKLRMPEAFADNVIAAADCKRTVLGNRRRQAIRDALLAHAGLEGHEYA